MTRSLFVVGLLCCALTVVGCSAAAPMAEPTAEPTRTVEPEPSPEPEPDPEARPVSVHLREVTPLGTDNAAMFARTPAQPDQGLADEAAQEATAVLEAFLDAQLRDPQTRFSAEPVEALLTPAALEGLDAAGRIGLGDVGDPFTWTVTGPARVIAHVLMPGGEASVVALRFDARIWAAFEEGKDAPLEMVTQRGELLFSPTDDGWRVSAADVRLGGPTALVETGQEAE